MPVKRLAKGWILVILMLCGCCGCARNGQALPAGDTAAAIPPEYADGNYENMEIYQMLRSEITEDMTLEQMVDAFERMCAVLLEWDNDMLLYEIYIYEDDDQFAFHLARQFQFPWDYEFVQLHLDVAFELTEDLRDLELVWWREGIEAEFFEEIKASEAFQAVKDRPITGVWVSIYGT